MRNISRECIRIRRLTVTLAMVGLLSLTATAFGGSPPEITFDIDFPGEILADGEKVQSFVFFKDPDKDISQIRFELTTPQQGDQVTLNPQVEGKVSGVIPFSLIAASSPLELEICVGEDKQCEKLRVSNSAPEEVSLSVTLTDKAGNSSEPKEFSFKVVAVEEPNEPPVARFSYSPAEPEVGEEVTFDASDSYDPDGDITSYEWDFGDGGTGSGKTARHAYSAEGSYRVELAVADDLGEIDSVTQTVLVKATSLGHTWFDDFDTLRLRSPWSWIREDATHWSLTRRTGFLCIMTQKGGLLFVSNNARNLLVQEAPLGDFEIQTHVVFWPRKNFQMAGLLVYQDDDRFLVLGRAYCDVAEQSCVGNGIYFDYEEREHQGNFVLTSSNLGEAYLRLVRQGDTYTGYYSENTTNWEIVGTYTASELTPLKIGLAVYNSSNDATEIPACFDYFRLIKD